VSRTFLVPRRPIGFGAVLLPVLPFPINY